MLKMTVTLGIALYLGLVIWGDAPDQAAAEPIPFDQRDIRVAAEYDRPVILRAEAQGADVTQAATVQTVVPDAATIAASAPQPAPGAPVVIGEPRRIRLSEGEPQTEAPDTTDTEGLYRVSGSRVNLRSGPSTANPVVDSLVSGTLTERLGDVSDGWVQIRDVTSGVTGYMAARFLEPA